MTAYLVDVEARTIRTVQLDPAKSYEQGRAHHRMTAAPSTWCASTAIIASSSTTTGCATGTVSQRSRTCEQPARWQPARRRRRCRGRNRFAAPDDQGHSGGHPDDPLSRPVAAIPDIRRPQHLRQPRQRFWHRLKGVAPRSFREDSTKYPVLNDPEGADRRPPTVRARWARAAATPGRTSTGSTGRMSVKEGRGPLSTFSP